MTKRAEAKYKIDRRMGENIWVGPQPGQQARIRTRPARPAAQGKATDFGTQLKAKQKIKGYYATSPSASSTSNLRRGDAMRATRAPT